MTAKVILIICLIIFIPGLIFAFGFGPFTAFGGKIIGTEDIIGISHQVFVVKEQADGSITLVVGAGTFIGGACHIGSAILGFGIKGGPFVQNVLSGCSPFQ